MSRTDDAPSERDEIEMLLPWYATGRLDAADTARVADWIARDPLLANHLKMIEEEHSQVVASAETVRMPAGMSQRTLSVIPGTARAGGVIDRFSDWLDAAISSLSPSRLKWVAAAALLLIALQATSIGVLLQGYGNQGDYRTASGRSISADGTFVLVRISDVASVATLNSALKSLEATIVAGPTAEGFYRIRIGSTSTDETARTASIERMKARSEIFTLVLPEPRSRTAP
jgi:anti-sigma factor RsiW